MRRIWFRGPRTLVMQRDSKGNETPLLGKRGGPVIKQDVTLVLVPKGATP